MIILKMLLPSLLRVYYYEYLVKEAGVPDETDHQIGFYGFVEEGE